MGSKMNPRFFLLVRIALLWLAIGLSLVMIYKLISGQQDGSQAQELIKRSFRRHRSSKATKSTAPTMRNSTISSLQSDGGGDEVVEGVRIAGRQGSPFAYITLMHGIDDSLSYRGFLYNAILMKRALHRLGSTADFLVLVGFTHGAQPSSGAVAQDLDLLQRNGIQLVYLPRLQDSKKVQFHEMALLKVLPWGFGRYQRVQFLDGDVLPHRNMDCLFNLSINTFNTGAASPLNSGWYLGIPNAADYLALRRLAVWRLSGRKWDDINGWGTPVPGTLKYRGLDRVVKKWEFNGASLDQGLCTHHFVLHEGRAQLLDSKVSTVYSANYTSHTVDIDEALQVCGGTKPVDMFYHFTGRNKPWLQDLSKPKDKALQYWATMLDEAQLNITSKEVSAQKMKSPLGYFFPNK